MFPITGQFSIAILTSCCSASSSISSRNVTTGSRPFVRPVVTSTSWGLPVDVITTVSLPNWPATLIRSRRFLRWSSASSGSSERTAVDQATDTHIVLPLYIPKELYVQGNSWPNLEMLYPILAGPSGDPIQIPAHLTQAIGQKAQSHTYHLLTLFSRSSWEPSARTIS